jgi:8-oxo-dGTP pyrophosphatase MutT (NUDIX family)
MSEKNSQSNSITKIYCGNCGKIGHTYKKCLEPITSLGLILYNVKTHRNFHEIKFLMIQRKDTVGYLEFLKGKYPDDNDSYLLKMIEVMTDNERKKIMENNFDDLWNKFIINKHYKKYEFNESKNKFVKLKKSGKLEQIINQAECHWNEPEWGFPKGRRHLKENDIDCAKREFEEETNLGVNDYKILLNVKTLEESYIGSNGIRYKHIYYMATSPNEINVEINENNISQKCEIGNIGWFSFQDALRKIRPYHKEKLLILKTAFSIVKSSKIYFREHDSVGMNDTVN